MKLRDWPVRRKFLLGTLIVTLPAIALVSIFLIVTEFRSVRATRLANAHAFVGMIAKNSATALLFDDPIVAQQILSGITAEPSAEVAALYDAEGDLYARFPTNVPPETLPVRGQPAGVRYSATRLAIFAEVGEEGKRAGFAYLRMDLRDMQRRQLIYVSTVAAISVAAIALVLLLSRLMERWIVTPLLDLSKTAKAVAAQGDYSLRAQKRGADEVGALVDAFNLMLNETQRSQNERQRAAEALRESERLMRVVTGGARVGLVVVDRDYRYLFANETYKEVLGLTQGDIIGRRVPDVLSAGWSQIQPHLDRALAGERVTYELSNPVEGAQRRYQHFALLYEPHQDDAGERTVVVVLADITERKGAEEALRESEERFRSMADNIGPLAWMANADGGLFFYNKRWFEYTGTTLEEMKGWGWSRVHHPEHIDRVVAKWKDHLRRGEAWEDTFPLRGRDGQYRWFLSRAFPIRNAQGEISRWFGTNTDITELRETQEALEEAQKKLRRHAMDLEKTVAERTARLSETVGELEAFSYSIAHDMRAPLRSMVGFSSILRSDYNDKLDSEGKDFLRKISTSAERLDRLIQDVLNYSKVVRGELKMEAIAPDRLVREIIESYPNLQPPNARIIIEEPIPKVMANSAALTQIISNLLGNAVKFVARGTEPRIRIWAETRGDRVRLWFEDNGIGIEPEAQKRLFQIFQRVHRPELYEGTGIGLAIVRKAAERMEGRVGVISEVNCGSRFWVELRRTTNE